MNLIETKKTEDGKSVVFTVEADAAEFEAAINKAFLKNKNSINVPGFRKGKATRGMIEKMYGKEVFYEDAIDDMLPGMYNLALAAGEEVVGAPTVGIDSMDAKEGLKVSFTLELRPVATVSNYKGLEAHKHTVNVTDEQVEHELGHLQERNSRKVEVEGRTAQMGDFANIYFKGFCDGVAFEGGEGEHDLELGSHSFIDGFEDQIVGHSVGEEFEINVKFPEEYEPSLAGKDAVFQIKLNELHAKEMPALDDDFAKDVSEFDTLDELKADIRANLEKSAAESSDAEFENSLLDKITDAMEVDLGTGLVNEYIEQSMSDFQNSLAANGLTLELYSKYVGVTEAELREQMRPSAEKSAKVRLALEAIARAEGFEATDEDVEKEIARIAERYGIEADKVKEVVDTTLVKKDVLCTKALDLVKATAVAVECDCDHDHCDCCEDGCDCDHDHCDCCDHE